MFEYHSDIRDRCLNALETISLSLLCSFIVLSPSDWASLTLTLSSTHFILGRNSSLSDTTSHTFVLFSSYSRHVLAWNRRSFWRAVRHIMIQATWPSYGKITSHITTSQGITAQ